jgi:hypothetical protein
MRNITTKPHNRRIRPTTGKMGMMSGDMMTQMPKMMMGQTETGKLVDQLVKSFTAIEAEKDPAALKGKLAEHGALLKELQTKFSPNPHDGHDATHDDRVDDGGNGDRQRRQEVNEQSRLQAHSTSKGS